MSGSEVRLIRPDDDEWPQSLGDLEVKDRPARLFVRGRRLDSLGPFAAIVGSRTPTAYGREVAFGLARDLALDGVCIVSGMARGIDAAAHEGALEAGGTTVAVLAAGVGRPYPPRHRLLFRRIIERGAVVSELEDGPTRPEQFEPRNRIIAGISLAVVIVQGKHRSGTSITARLAHAIHRELFAVPGDIRSDKSALPHALLRDSAHLCRGAADVLELLGLSQSRNGVAADAPIPEGLDDDAAAVLAVVGAEPSAAEAVVARCGLGAIRASQALSELELLGLVGRAPGGTYYRRR